MVVKIMKAIAPLDTSAPGIYAIKNLADGKCYVGSSKNMKARFAQHRSGLLNGKHTNHYLQAAWSKHGPNSFEFTVLEICQDWSKEVQYSRENAWIKKLNPEYNLAPVAESSLGIKRSNETKERMALSANLRRQKWIRSILVQMTGGLATAVLLEQIIYWHSPGKDGKSKLRARFLGDYWLAKPREEMLMETGISLKQYQAAISKLKSLKIIDYRIGGFAGKPTPYIRLDADRIVSLSHGIEATVPDAPGCTASSIVSNGNKPLLPFAPNLCAVLPQTNTDSLTISLTIKEPAATQPEPQQNQVAEDLTGGAEMLPKNGLKKGPTNVQATLEKLAMPAAEKKQSKIMGLYKLWAITVPAHHEEVKFVGKFTRKQEAQLLMLAKAWDTPEKVLEHTLIRWVKFGKLVVSQTEAKTYPSIPSVDFLVKHKDIAMNFYLSASKVPEEKSLLKPGAINCTEEPTPMKVAQKVSIGKVLILGKPKLPSVVKEQAPEPVQDKAALKQQLLKELLKG